MDNVRIGIRNLLSVIVDLCLLVVGIADLADAQMQKVRITISSRSNTSVPYYVAVSKGFFREEGMDVEVIQANPRLGVMALMNGDVYFTGTFVSTVRGILSGFPLEDHSRLVQERRLLSDRSSERERLQRSQGQETRRVEHSRLRIIWSPRNCCDPKDFNPARLQPVVLGDTVGTLAIGYYRCRRSDDAVAAP